MAQPQSPIQFEDIPLDETRRLGGPRMDPALYQQLRERIPSLAGAFRNGRKYRHRRDRHPEQIHDHGADEAEWSIAVAQAHSRYLRWDDLIASLQENHHHDSMLTALERLRVA